MLTRMLTSEPASPVRRRDPVRTKARILDAAVAVFSTAGYAQAGLREIAAKAGVASSLPIRYFGTKAALFEAALIEIVRANSVFTWRKEDFGETMTRLLCERSSVTITAVLIQALSDPEAREVATRLWREHMLEPLAQWLGHPDAHARAGVLFALLSGLTFQFRGLAEGDMPPDAERWISRTLQALVDEGEPTRPSA